MQSKRQTSKRNGLRNNDVTESKQGHLEDIEDSKCDPHFNKTKLKSETQNEPTDSEDTCNSSYHLGTIVNRNICKGVLEKFHYLKKKMELENVKGSVKDAKGRKRKCNSLYNDNDKVEEIPVETKEEKIDDDESGQCNSCTYDTRRHRTGNASERRNSRKKEGPIKGIKQNKTSKEKETKELEQKNKVQIEQEKLFNKLKGEAKCDESSFYESDCETENKLSDKAVALRGKVRHSNSSIKGTKHISENLLANASEVKDDKSSIESNIGSAVVEKKCSNEGGRSDWREQLLLLEMSHNEFDDNIAENHASDQTDESECTKIVRSAQSKDLNVDIKRKGRLKRMRNEAKVGLKCEGSQTLKSARNIKIDTNNIQAVVLHKNDSDMKDLSDQVRDIRKRKKTEKAMKTQAKFKDVDDNTVDNKACIRLNFSDSALSSSNQNDDCHTNCYEDFRLSLDSAVPCSVSTPRAQSKVEKTYLKKKTGKRKIRMVSNRKSYIKDNHLSTEHEDDVIHEIPSLDISLPTPKPPRNDYNPFR